MHINADGHLMEGTAINWCIGDLCEGNGPYGVLMFGSLAGEIDIYTRHGYDDARDDLCKIVAVCKEAIAELDEREIEGS